MSFNSANSNWSWAINAQLHQKINNQQAKLWNQQLQIAVFTAPNAIEKTVKGQQMDMVPVYAVKPTETDDDAE